MTTPTPSIQSTTQPKPVNITSEPATMASTPATMASKPVIIASRWHNGLFGGVCGGDNSSCLGAWFFPPFLYGRAAQRLDLYPRTDPLLFNSCNQHCWMFHCSCCCVWLPVALKREQLRERFNIPGGLCSDIAASMFCIECTLAQMNTELKRRAAKEPLKAQIGYQPHPQGMVYLPPDQQQPQLQQQPPQLQQQPPQLQQQSPPQQGV